MEEVLEHHKKQEVCYTRPAYREARWERAVKVYTVNLESRYLLVQNVPALGVVKEVLELFSLYGDIEEHRLLDEYPAEEYTDVYFIKYSDINDARVAKRKLDNRSFFGKQLHVSYAPEFETVQDTRSKLQDRRRAIAQKTRGSWEKAQREVSSGAKSGNQSGSGKVVFNTAAPSSTTASKSISHASTVCESHLGKSVQITSESCELPGSSISGQSVLPAAREVPVAAVMLPGIPPLPLLPPPPLPSHPLLPTKHRFTHESVTTAASKSLLCETVSSTGDRAHHTSPGSSHPPIQKSLPKTSQSSAGLTRDERIALHMEEYSDGNVRTAFLSPSVKKETHSHHPSSRPTKIPLTKRTLTKDARKGSVPDNGKLLEHTAHRVGRDSTATLVVSCSQGHLSSRTEVEELRVSSTPYPLLPQPAGPSNQFGQPLAPQPPESITGHSSLDSTISSVRARMDQVFKRPNLDVPDGKHKPKKRKRI